MAYLYTAFASFFDANKRFVNLTQAPTLTAHNALTGAALAGAVTITNIAIGRYRVQVTEDALTDVMFGVVPHVDDQALHPDVPLLQEKVYHVADDILVDTGTTLPASIATVDTVVDAVKVKTDQLAFTLANKVDAHLAMTAIEIINSVEEGLITQMRGDTWTIVIENVVLDTHKQQFVLKRTSGSSDANAILFIDSVTGLLIVNGVTVAIADNGKASLTYSAVLEKLTITVAADIAAQMPADTIKFGIQSVTSGGVVVEPYGGDFVIPADIVRATA